MILLNNKYTKRKQAHTDKPHTCSLRVRSEYESAAIRRPSKQALSSLIGEPITVATNEGAIT